jgi:hypothetical protein
MLVTTDTDPLRPFPKRLPEKLKEIRRHFKLTPALSACDVSCVNASAANITMSSAAMVQQRMSGLFMVLIPY